MSTCAEMQAMTVEPEDHPKALIGLAKTMAKLDYVSHDLDYAVS